MANFRYFAEHNGQTVQLANVWHDGHMSAAASHFLGYAAEELAAWKAGGTRAVALQAARVIEFKSNPSRHECDTRCTHATGKVMKCECSCGGKNHGKGGAA